MIAALEAKIAAIKAREAQRADPALRHVRSSVKAIEQALAATKNAETRHALLTARSALSPLVQIKGGGNGRRRRSADRPESLAEALLAYVRANPGQRGEQIAAALGTDATTMRPVMKRLIQEGKVRTEGQRRGMTYAAAQ